MSIKRRIIFILTSFFLGILYLRISFLVDRDIFRTVDYRSMISLQKTVSHKFDLSFSFFSLLGSSEITLLAIGIIFLAVFFKKRHVFLGLFLYFTIFIIELMGKLLIFHPAPPKILNRYILGFHFPSSFIVHTDFSYPSGHMARSTYVVMILLFLLFFSKSEPPRLSRGFLSVTGGETPHRPAQRDWCWGNWYKKGVLFFLLNLFMAVMFLSRIYLGEHWFSDCLGGLILGSGVATLAMGFW